MDDGGASAAGGAREPMAGRVAGSGVGSPSGSGAARSPSITFAERGRRTMQFSIALVFRRALHTFRAAPGLIVGLALLVFVPISLLDAAVTQYGHHIVESDPFDQMVSVVAQLLDLFVDLLGFAFFGGLLDHLVGRIHHGHEAHRPQELARQLSYGRLISASIVFNLTVVVGVVVLIIPGLILFTMFTFVGPLINIERVSVPMAFRRSYRISRPYLAGIAVTVTLPFILEQILDGVLEGLPFAHGFWGEFGVGLVMSLIGTGIVVLLEVCTAYHLLELEAERVGGPGPSHSTAS